MKKRILIKLSGEALSSEASLKVALEKIAFGLKELQDASYQVGLVLGGGNFFRGAAGADRLLLRRTQADQVGMMATLMNGLLLSETLVAHKIPHKLLSAVSCEFVTPFSDQAMREGLDNEGIVIFVGGTSHPYFTTDTAAALRATEMGASLLLKATTKVDGIYNKDPRKHSDAVRYEKISYTKAVDEKLQILDITAFTLCMENKIAIRVYKYGEHSFLKAAQENHIGSLVTEG